MDGHRFPMDRDPLSDGCGPLFGTRGARFRRRGCFSPQEGSPISRMEGALSEGPFSEGWGGAFPEGWEPFFPMEVAPSLRIRKKTAGSTSEAWAPCGLLVGSSWNPFGA